MADACEPINALDLAADHPSSDRPAPNTGCERIRRSKPERATPLWERCGIGAARGTPSRRSLAYA